MQTYPRYKLIFLSFFHGSQGIARNIEERKVDVFFVTISVVIPAIQLLTQNINKELQRSMFSINVNHPVGDYTALSKKTYGK